MIVCLAEARQEELNTSILYVRQEKKKGEPKTYCWTLLGQHMAVVAFGGSIGIAIVVRSLGMLAVANGDINNLRGVRGNIVVNIGVITGVSDEIEIDDTAAAVICYCCIGRSVLLLLLSLRMLALLLQQLQLVWMSVSMSGVLPQLLKVQGSHA